MVSRLSSCVKPTVYILVPQPFLVPVAVVGIIEFHGGILALQCQGASHRQAVL